MKPPVVVALALTLSSRICRLFKLEAKLTIQFLPNATTKARRFAASA